MARLYAFCVESVAEAVNGFRAGAECLSEIFKRLTIKTYGELSLLPCRTPSWSLKADNYRDREVAMPTIRPLMPPNRWPSQEMTELHRGSIPVSKVPPNRMPTTRAMAIDVSCFSRIPTVIK